MSTAAIGIAQANRYPDVRLSATLTQTDTGPDGLFGYGANQSLQGTVDNNLTDDMASRLAASYRKAGGSIDLHIFPNQPHAFIPNAPTAPDSVRALGLIRDFVHAHAKP